MSLPNTTGILLANPIGEKLSIPRSEMDHVIREAVQSAQSRGVIGSSNTPFVLQEIERRTKGKSLEVNEAIIRLNVKTAAIVAKELANLDSRTPEETNLYDEQQAPSVSMLTNA